MLLSAINFSKNLLNEMYEDVALKGSINHSKVVYSTPTFGLLQG